MKTMMRILAVLLCMLMAVPAFAEAVPVASNVITNTFVYRTNFLCAPGERGYYMATIDGTPVTDAIYDNFEYQLGYITAAKLDVDSINQNGMFDMSGNIVLPFEYGDINVLRGGEWVTAVVLADSTADNYDYRTYNDEYFIIERVDIFHMPDMAVMSLARENYMESDVVNHCINIKDRTTGVITTYDASFTALGTVDQTYSTDHAPADYVRFRENGQYGYTDAAGNVIMAPTYGYLDTNDSYKADYVTISADESYGLVRRSTGEVIVPAEYERVISNFYATGDKTLDREYSSCGYYCVVADGKVGYVTEGGAVTCAPKYSYDLATIYGASYTIVDLEGNTILMAADGVETVLPEYNSMYVLDFTSGIYYKVTNADYNYGVIDWHGNEVLPCKYSSINISGDGQYILACEDYSVTTLFQLSYPNGSAAAQAPAAAEAAPETGEDGSSAIGGFLGNLMGGSSEEAATEEIPVEEPTAEEVPVEETVTEETPVEAPEADASADNSGALGLLTSAVTLLSTDASANGTAAVSLIDTAAGMLAGRDDVTGLLTSASTLLGIDPAANAIAALSLIESAIALLQ